MKIRKKKIGKLYDGAKKMVPRILLVRGKSYLLIEWVLVAQMITIVLRMDIGQTEVIVVAIVPINTVPVHVKSRRVLEKAQAITGRGRIQAGQAFVGGDDAILESHDGTRRPVALKHNPTSKRVQRAHPKLVK